MKITAVEEKKYPVQEVFEMIGEQYLLGDNDFNKNRAPDLDVDGFKVHAVSLSIRRDASVWFAARKVLTSAFAAMKPLSVDISICMPKMAL